MRIGNAGNNHTVHVMSVRIDSGSIFSELSELSELSLFVKMALIMFTVVSDFPFRTFRSGRFSVIFALIANQLCIKSCCEQVGKVSL